MLEGKAENWIEDEEGKTELVVLEESALTRVESGMRLVEATGVGAFDDGVPVDDVVG